MNINLSAAAAARKKKKVRSDANIGFGLNTRGAVGRSVLEAEDDESSEGENGAGGGMDAIGEVNRDLVAQQAALRKRANRAQKYDFDGTYEETTAAPAAAAKVAAEEAKKKKGSRYVGDLLKASERRLKEREVIFERKLAKEQADEDAIEDFKGKEKFVTKSYKRKLAERELWAKEDEILRQQEESEDVMKKKDGGAFASFYGNLGKNVAMGGPGVPLQNTVEEEKSEDGVKGRENRREPTNGISTAFGFGTGKTESVQSDCVISVPQDKETKHISARKAREERVAQSRLRYFQRQDIPENERIAKQ